MNNIIWHTLVVCALISVSGRGADAAALGTLVDASFTEADLATVLALYRGENQVNVLVRAAGTNHPPITLELKQVPLGEVLRFVARSVNMTYEPRPFGAIFSAPYKPLPARPPTNLLRQKLQQRIDVEFKEQSLLDAVQCVVQGHGLNLVLIQPAAWADKTVTLTLKKVTIAQVLQYLQEFSRVPISIDGCAVVVGGTATK
ncbi:MAG: hypothetical protein NTV22_17535 [bacterium]|nr:hypothetical protein [bacterium]